MTIKWLRRIVLIKWLSLKVLRVINVTKDVILYLICNLFLAVLALIAIYFLTYIILTDEVVQHYVIGLSVLLATGLSIAYISKFNKKYRKNDSNSSKRQNDFLFETDLPWERERKGNRRNLE
jgi:ABC-type bacteriocin/lantibiotic exporter with double-glycine peptidase domain